MENEDAQAAIRLLEQIHEIQAANLEVQRKLLDTVVAQYARSEEASKRVIERTTLLQDRTTVLQDRTMDMLIMNRRILSYGLPLCVVAVALFFWMFAFGVHR
jgi:hypothetical protein